MIEIQHITIIDAADTGHTLSSEECSLQVDDLEQLRQYYERNAAEQYKRRVNVLFTYNRHRKNEP